MITLSCRNVTVGYGKKEIVRNVSFEAKNSEITVVLGRNGSGKTTLLRAVSGVLPYGGSITVNSREVCDMRTYERARQIAVMPQLLRSPEVSVRELVSFGRQPYAGVSGILSSADREMVERVLEKTGLAPLAGERLSRISGGERQKAYFAMLLAQDTPVLLLDEPGAHLDMSYRKQLSQMLREEKGSGKIIVAVLHDVNRAVELADRILVLRGGTLVFSGTPEAFCDSVVPADVFGLERHSCVGPDGREATPVFR